MGCTISTYEGNENIHQLPLKNEYQFYDNLYALVLQEQKYSPLNMETFENIYNALYLKMEDESDEADSIYTSEDEDLEDKNLDDVDEEDNIMEDGGEGEGEVDGDAEGEGEGRVRRLKVMKKLI